MVQQRCELVCLHTKGLALCQALFIFLVLKTESRGSSITQLPRLLVLLLLLLLFLILRQSVSKLPRLVLNLQL